MKYWVLILTKSKELSRAKSVHIYLIGPFKDLLKRSICPLFKPFNQGLTGRKYLAQFLFFQSRPYWNELPQLQREDLSKPYWMSQPVVLLQWLAYHLIFISNECFQIWLDLIIDVIDKMSTCFLNNFWWNNHSFENMCLTKMI